MELSNSSKTEAHLFCVDGLKGIGAFIIAFIWHYQVFNPINGSPFSSVFYLSYSFGWSMVDLFFILSGFGLMKGYGSRILEEKISFPTFILKRIRKLYPLFIFTTIVVFILEYILCLKTGDTFGYHDYDIYHLIINILMLQDGLLGTDYSFNAPSWCIPVFLLVYIMFYSIIYWVKEYRHILYCFCVTAGLGLVLTASELHYPLLNDMIGRGIAGFSVGVIIAYLFKASDRFNTLRLGYLCLLFLTLSYYLLRFRSLNWAGANYTLTMMLGFGPMIVFSTLFIPWLKEFIGNPLFRFLGNVSWEIYLFHFPVACCIEIVRIICGLKVDYSGRIIWVIYVLVTIGVATLYHYVFAGRFEKLLFGLFRKA